MEPEVDPFPVVRIAHVQPEPQRARWLVEGLWAEAAVGVIGGTPKAGKTWLALDLAVAVASGRPALGRFAVRKPGPVLVYAAEDSAPDLRERVAGLAAARGIPRLDRLPLGLITEPALRLDLPGHQLRLDATLRAIQPRLLVLDPLVRLHRQDENSSAEISAMLGFLRGLQRTHGGAIVLVHHVRKSGASQPGQALRGSGDLHAWGDSNLFLLRKRERTWLHVEHRSHPAAAPIAVGLRTGPTRLEVEEDGEAEVVEDLDQAVLDALQGGEPARRTELRRRLRVRNERLGEALARLEAAGRVRRSEAGWAVPCSPP